MQCAHISVRVIDDYDDHDEDDDDNDDEYDHDHNHHDDNDDDVMMIMMMIMMIMMIMMMMIVLITGKQGGDSQSEDCSRHRDNGESGAVIQWSILLSPQSAHLGCYLHSLLLLSTLVEQQNSNKPKPFLLTVQLYLIVCLYFYLIVYVCCLCIHSCAF